jgi:hypothetical protein
VCLTEFVASSRPTIQRVEQRRFPQAAVAGEDAQLSGQRIAEALDPLARGRRAMHNRNCQDFVGPQRIELRPVVKQVDLVHAHHAPMAIR